MTSMPSQEESDHSVAAAREDLEARLTRALDAYVDVWDRWPGITARDVATVRREAMRAALLAAQRGLPS